VDQKRAGIEADSGGASACRCAGKWMSPQTLPGDDGRSRAFQKCTPRKTGLIPTHEYASYRCGCRGRTLRGLRARVSVDRSSYQARGEKAVRRTAIAGTALARRAGTSREKGRENAVGPTR
jgi:hypothetical protein